MILTYFSLNILLIVIIFIGVFAYFWFGEFLANVQFKRYWQKHNQEYPELQLFLTAIEKNDLEALKGLISNGLDVNKQYEFYNGAVGHARDYTTPFLYAITLNKPDCVKLCLHHGADVSGPNFSTGKTPLYFAAELGSIAIAELLLSHGANVDYRGLDEFTYFDNTPLHGAASKGHVEMVKFLIKHGATIDSVNEYGQTPLHLAAKHGFESAYGKIVRSVTCNNYAAITKLLLVHGAAVDQQDNANNTPLHFAVHYSTTDQETEGDQINVVKILLQAGANKDARNLDNQTPLMCTQNKKIVTLLR